MRRVRHTRLRLERESHLKIVRARREHDGRQVRARLVVHGDAVAAGLLDRSEVLLGTLSHQVTVDERAARVDDRRDRLEDDRAHRDRLDEVTVADVEVEHMHAGAKEHVDLLAQAREVGRIERRLDLHRSDPVVPAHVRCESRF